MLQSSLERVVVKSGTRPDLIVIGIRRKKKIRNTRGAND